DRLTCEENLTFQFLLCGRRRFWDHDGGAERDNEPELSSELHRRSSCLLARRPRAQRSRSQMPSSGQAPQPVGNRAGITFSELCTFGITKNVGHTTSINPHAHFVSL